MMTLKTPFKPPQDFQQVTSAIDGITVFAPRERVDHSADTRTYACPQCGASLEFDLASSGLGCPYCGYQQAVQAEHVGHNAQRSEFTVETMKNAERGWGSLRQALHCENCGAELSFPVGAIAASCPYCVSNKVNVQTAVDEKMRPRYLVPFKIKSDQLPALAATWLGKGWFHPKTLATSTIIRQFNGIYLPYWAFDTEIEASWRAEVGREVTYQVYNAAEKRWETRTKIVWEWKQGRQHIPFIDHLVIGINQQIISHHMLKRIEPFHLAELVAYQPDFLVGLQAQAYDLTLPNAWEAAKANMREYAMNDCRSSISSPHVRNFSMTADFADESWRYILLPVFLAAYRFDSRLYQVIINGQTGALSGQKPVDWKKIRWVIVASLLPGLLLLLMSYILYNQNMSDAPMLCIGPAMLIAGIAISLSVYHKAKEAEKGK